MSTLEHNFTLQTKSLCAAGFEIIRSRQVTDNGACVTRDEMISALLRELEANLSDSFAQDKDSTINVFKKNAEKAFLLIDADGDGKISLKESLALAVTEKNNPTDDE